MINKPLLSIHILTYNHEKYIEECMDSIFAYPINHNIEIVISDDASNDSTPKILQKYKEKHPNIIDLQINTKNKGIIKNYFDTLNRCQGEFYIDISGDDFFNPNAINIICEEIMKHKNLDFIEFEYDEFYQDNKIQVRNVNSFLRKYTHSEYLFNVFNLHILPFAWCIKIDTLKKLISKDELIANNIYAEDYPIAIELIANNKTFIHKNTSILTYRRLKESTSNDKDPSNQIKLYDTVINNLLFYSKKHDLPKAWIKEVEKTFNKKIFHISRLFNDKELGKNYYKKILTNNGWHFIDYINYLSTQNIIFRTLYFWYHNMTTKNKIFRNIRASFRKKVI